MAYVPDCCFIDAQTELVSDTGAIKHAALTLYGYYCLRRNKDTKLCFPKLGKTVSDTGITPKSNVSMLKTFLKNVAWIEVYDSGVIRPLKGFYPDETRFLIWLKNFLAERISVLIFRTLVLHNRTAVLLCRTLFKGSTNQLIQPAQLTSVSADNSAKPPADKNNLKNQPAGKPAPRMPASPQKPVFAAPAGKPADERINNAAIKMVKEITGRYPPKDLWERIIRELPKITDGKFFQASWEIWRSVGGNPQNFEKWLFEPAKTGFPPEVFATKNGKSPPDKGSNWAQVGKTREVYQYDETGAIIPQPKSEYELLRDIQMFIELELTGRDLLEYEKFYTPDDWAWLMTEKEIYAG